MSTRYQTCLRNATKKTSVKYMVTFELGIIAQIILMSSFFSYHRIYELSIGYEFFFCRESRVLTLI